MKYASTQIWSSVKACVPVEARALGLSAEVFTRGPATSNALDTARVAKMRKVEVLRMQRTRYLTCMYH